MQLTYQQFLIRDWQPEDRDRAAQVVAQVLAEYGLEWEPTGSDRDVIDVEAGYRDCGGEFWVVEQAGCIVGTAGYRPFSQGDRARGDSARGDRAVEIRKMYLLPTVRGQGLGKFLLATLEAKIAAQGHQQIWVETASVLTQAVKLYEKQGYQPATGIDTPRCDRVYVKFLIDSLSSL